ncbi:hypothetical protein PMAYCL1PPCAC_14016 [Pristionchus mayeri]|uniref:BHLH domain-containing protein n=1 Tax=Pristionchus mayeri TaxID=1317129 RepID=A0AAN5CHE4_9BILA|nr:hypothetical protein PMAYCL1PPCAC_14016 [Pristionchus mayeri]
MVRSESADEERMKMEMMDDLDDDCLDVDTVDGAPGILAGDAVRMRAWTEAGGRVMGGSGSASVSPTNGIEKTGNADIDRRIRRQIANCNERRRMQSINAGFQSLRALLPRKEGEKLSKAAILQQTAELIQQLRAERSRFLQRTGSSEEDTMPSGPPSAVWKKPRLERESDSFESIPSSSSSSAASSQNNIAAAAAAQSSGGSGAAGAAASLSVTPTTSSLSEMPQITELQNQLERERVMRMYLESKLRTIGSASTTPTPLSPIPSFGGLAQLGLQGSPLLDSTRLLSGGDRSPLTTMAAAAALAASAAAADSQQQQAAAAAAAAAASSVIRPTPTQPLRVDVSLANLVSLSNASSAPSLQQQMEILQQQAGTTVAQQQPPVSTPPSAFTARTLNVLLEAIKQMEGSVTSSSPPPSSHANLLVR